MKRTMKIIGGIAIGVFISVSILLTVYLLNFNNYGVSQIGDLTFLTIQDNSAKLESGSLNIVRKTEVSSINEGDWIFFYQTQVEEDLIRSGEVSNVRKLNESEATFELEGGRDVSSYYLIGSYDEVTTIPLVGNFIQVLSSRWGFLFLIIAPISMLLIYQIYALFNELKKDKK